MLVWSWFCVVCLIHFFLTIEAPDVNWILSLFFSQPFPFNEIMHFQSSSLCFYYAFTHHFPLSGTLKADLPLQTPALYTENERSNFKEYIVVVEEEEWDENNIREFIKLIKQHEQAWKPVKEELETIDVGNEEIKEKNWR